MPTRNVVLTPHHERIIETLLNTGRYRNASEILREGLRLIEAREAGEAARLEALRGAAKIGCHALDNGCFREWESDQTEDFLARIGEQAAAGARSLDK